MGLSTLQAVLKLSAVNAERSYVPEFGAERDKLSSVYGLQFVSSITPSFVPEFFMI